MRRAHRASERSRPYGSFATLLDLQAAAGNQAVVQLVTNPHRPRVQRCGAVPPSQCPCHLDESAPAAVQRHEGGDGAGGLVSTPATPSSPFSDDELASWFRALDDGGGRGALDAIVQVMQARGEIEPGMMSTRTVERGPAVCATAEAFQLDQGVGRAHMNSCGCEGDRTPNPRIRVHPDLVRAGAIGVTPEEHRRAAARLHRTLLHEYRHVLQHAEACAQGGVSRGWCTDCNAPEEMDAYLAEVEAGYDRWLIYDAWAQVYGRWGYLSPRQQETFQPRLEAARAKVERRFPGTRWEDNARVAAVRDHCEALGDDAPNDVEHRGACDAALAPA